jgi:hypothetical protein
MQTEDKPQVVFRFCRPSGLVDRRPSQAMTAALRRLSQADEVQPLLRRARAAGRDVVIEVFHSQDGQPLLIHLTLKPVVNR